MAQFRFSPVCGYKLVLGLWLVIQQHEGFVTGAAVDSKAQGGRQRISINDGWRFWRSPTNPDGLLYDERPDTVNLTDVTILKPWVLPSANMFIQDPANHHKRPAEEPDVHIPYVKASFDDSTWESVSLPHDWAIAGPFYTDDNPIVSGGMGRLPTFGVGWYRKTISMSHEDKGKNFYLEMDGAMSYPIVWVNGKIVGGWPYGYNSFQLDLTPYMNVGDNQVAIRLDNPNESSRWYPGGGIYRDVWLITVASTHVGQWGTFITSRDVSARSATLDLAVEVQNNGDTKSKIDVTTDVHEYDAKTGQIGAKVAAFPQYTVLVAAGKTASHTTTTAVKKPLLWGPPPFQTPNLYMAVTKLHSGSQVIDTFETRFGIRTFAYEPNKGLIVNGEHIPIRGTNQHHDLGALGAAYNHRAQQRHLDILQSFGSNAIRMSHNPPAPGLMDLADEMGFLVMDEIFDCWVLGKTTNDFHLIFPDWHEPDLRAFIRRDRNHPSIFVWSVGNEVGEQQTGDDGAKVAQELVDIAHDMDPTRPVTASMNSAHPNQPFPVVMDVLSLNYQGQGIRDTPNYSQLGGIGTPPAYPAFHGNFSRKMLESSESASALSSRGTFIFPVLEQGDSAPVNDTSGGNSTTFQVSAYELYSADYGSSADKEFRSLDQNPYVAGEFVWTGWDYLGEPTPYNVRSSYSGIVDLAGFPKERFYIYQSRWQPDLRMAHILPHWTWPDRAGKVTPVHVFSSGDEAELFVNGKSQGRQTKEPLTYRFRWDKVVYHPGELHVVTYKDGKVWAKDTVQTAGEPARLRLTADRSKITADGLDLSYLSVEVLDHQGRFVPQATNAITFSVSGAGQLVATDNGDPSDYVSFPSPKRHAYSGRALAIVKGEKGQPGKVVVEASADGLASSKVTLHTIS
ncbi:hypothetical protein CI102_9750 [Trichoderma harzianum]|nr:hypothetical protein CI102_9750 [Trichoderma harzianum]